MLEGTGLGRRALTRIVRVLPLVAVLFADAAMAAREHVFLAGTVAERAAKNNLSVTLIMKRLNINTWSGHCDKTGAVK